MVESDPIAIVDIGSNSIRLVVYVGIERIPAVIFNEKVMAGLGESLSATGSLSEASQDRAVAVLRRFWLLIKQMGVKRVRAVATAAVRDASNGAAFLARVRETGFKAEILSGEEEGIMAGQGVLSGIPDADGLVGDLGGGSLELVDVGARKVRHSASLPFGVLRIGKAGSRTEAALAKTLQKALRKSDFDKRGRGRPFYLVGGSWRALARFDMLQIDYPLPIVHQYTMRSDRPAELSREIDRLQKRDARKGVKPLSSSRLPLLPQANMLLKLLVEQLRPSHLIVSSFGIREGLLYDELPGKLRQRDPLIEAAREAGRGLGRFAEHGALLDSWIAPIFGDDAETARLRLAACLLADVAWRAHPDFRAERGVDMALHGNWVAIDGPGRVMIAQALFSNFGGEGNFAQTDVAALCNPDELKRASQWGLAMRLGQRLSGGVAEGLDRSRLSLRDGTLQLTLKPGEEPLYGETVARRLKTLASALGRSPLVA
jgi:exopolyphosphatase / guanosine-5'-triphosphate,3'-diphosphate pyrophosphatase